jgi:hypothetical protein
MIEIYRGDASMNMKFKRENFLIEPAKQMVSIKPRVERQRNPELYAFAHFVGFIWKTKLCARLPAQTQVRPALRQVLLLVL